MSYPTKLSIQVKCISVFSLSSDFSIIIKIQIINTEKIKIFSYIDKEQSRYQNEAAFWRRHDSNYRSEKDLGPDQKTGILHSLLLDKFKTLYVNINPQKISYFQRKKLTAVSMQYLNFTSLLFLL